MEHLVIKKITQATRAFKLAYLRYLRTGKHCGHQQHEEVLRIYTDLMREHKGGLNDFDAHIMSIKEECRKAIDDETQQLSLLDVV